MEFMHCCCRSRTRINVARLERVAAIDFRVRLSVLSCRTHLCAHTCQLRLPVPRQSVSLSVSQSVHQSVNLSVCLTDCSLMYFGVIIGHKLRQRNYLKANAINVWTQVYTHLPACLCVCMCVGVFASCAARHTTLALITVEGCKLQMPHAPLNI